MTTVSELMTKNVAAVRTSDPLSSAAKLMWDRDCGVVPVIDAGNERVLGMITDRDICMAAWMKGRSPGDISVSEAMSPKLYSCGPQDSIMVAENMMRAKQIRRLPVIDGNGRLVGILSLADIVRRTRPQNSKDKTAPIAADDVASMLAEICQPSRSPTNKASA